MADDVTPADVLASDLATYLGIDSDALDTDRAEMLINLATQLCQAIIDPVPGTATAVILSAAARAYSNPMAVTSEMVGPYQATRPSGGVYLTKSERAALRRASGGGGAFSVDLIPGYPDARFS